WVLAFQEQKLRGHQSRLGVVDAAADENDPLLQQARKDIVPVGAAARRLLDAGNDDAGQSLERIKRHGGLSRTAAGKRPVLRSYLTPLRALQAPAAALKPLPPHRLRQLSPWFCAVSWPGPARSPSPRAHRHLQTARPGSRFGWSPWPIRECN